MRRKPRPQSAPRQVFSVPCFHPRHDVGHVGEVSANNSRAAFLRLVLCPLLLGFLSLSFVFTYYQLKELPRVTLTWAGVFKL